MYDTAVLVVTLYPLQQGLKHRMLHCLLCDHLRVVTLYPLQQGLKPVILIV